jgi:hypothetical protein
MPDIPAASSLDLGNAMKKPQTPIESSVSRRSFLGSVLAVAVTGVQGNPTFAAARSRRGGHPQVCTSCADWLMFFRQALMKLAEGFGWRALMRMSRVSRLGAQPRTKSSPSDRNLDGRPLFSSGIHSEPTPLSPWRRHWKRAVSKWITWRRLLRRALAPCQQTFHAS